MREITCTGKTVDIAIEKGLEELGLTRDEVSVRVLEMPVRKFFSTTPAKVYICEDKEEVAAAGKPKPSQPKPIEAKNIAVKNIQPKATSVAPAAFSAAATSASSTAPIEKELNKEPEKPYKRTEEEQLLLDKKIAVGTDFLREVLKEMGFADVTITSEPASRATILKVEGSDVASLIGRRGETMEALSYITSLVANQQGGSFEKLTLDVAGYREKRSDDLTALAKKIAQNVIKSGRSYALEPMNPYERRIIHTAVGEIEGVRSESAGDGATRHIVIYSESTLKKHSEMRRNTNSSAAKTRPYQNQSERKPFDKNAKRPFDKNSRDSRGPKPPPIVSSRTEKINDDEAKPLYSKVEF